MIAPLAKSRLNQLASAVAEKAALVDEKCRVNNVEYSAIAQNSAPAEVTEALRALRNAAIDIELASTSTVDYLSSLAVNVSTLCHTDGSARC